MTKERLQELINNEATIYVVDEHQLFEIHTKKDYKVMDCGIDNGNILLPFNLDKVYEKINVID